MADAVTSNQPLRTPSWRYQLARQAVANGQLLLPSQADPVTRKLARYLRRETLCSTTGQRRRLAAGHADLAAALELFRAPERQTACQLEIQILAREKRSAAAEAVHVSPATVDYYKLCLFFVEPYLDDSDYILEYAIRPELKCSPTETAARLRFVSKLLAYFCGLDALEQLVPTGSVGHIQPWRHPLRIIQQLVNQTELSQLAELSEARAPSFARDPQRFAVWRDGLMRRVQASLTVPIAQRPTQRHDRQDTKNLGMGGFDR